MPERATDFVFAIFAEEFGLLPIAGIPLPLISYGGSATVTTLAALGLVQSAALRRKAIAGGDGGIAVLGTIIRRAQA